MCLSLRGIKQRCDLSVCLFLLPTGPPHNGSFQRHGGKILVLDLQQNSGKTAENALKLILLLIKSGFVERKCVILLLCCVIW